MEVKNLLCVHVRAQSNTKAHKQRQKTEVDCGVAGPCDMCRWMENVEMGRDGQGFSLLSLN